jgi:microcompartment protein CcmK/EutM
MYIAKVVANVVSTQKSHKVLGKKILIVQPLDAEGNPFGDEVTALDGVGAGIGDIVIALGEGWSARTVADVPENSPVEVVIAGIIDFVDTDYGRLTSDGKLLK